MPVKDLATLRIHSVLQCIKAISNAYCLLQVHLCEALHVTELLGDDFLVNRCGSRNIMVAVKILRHDADDQARYVSKCLIW